MIEKYYSILFILCLIFLSITILFCLIRAIIGPRILDRIIAINMIGVKAIILIAILAFRFEKNYLLDICLVYAMISFLAMVVFTKLLSKHNQVKITKMNKDLNNIEGK
ncbi:MAG: monovalent cation/H+ antiporter complex subunit F [Clostridium sp.]